MIHKTRWTAEKIAGRLRLIEPLVYRRSIPLSPFRYKALSGPMEPPLTAPGTDTTSWQVVQPYSYWGEWFTDFMLCSEFTVPESWGTDSAVALYLPLGNSGDFTHPEALAYVDGDPYATCDRFHQEILLPPRWQDGKLHKLALHGWTGLGGAESPRPEVKTKLFMGECSIVQLDQPTRDFIVTSRVALGIARALDANEPAKGHLLNALNDAFNILDTREPFGDGFYASIPASHDTLKAGIAKAGPPLDVTVFATGHAHLDVAWLWTLGEIRRKSGRTFHNVIRLMEQFPEYHFTQSQPQLYDYVRQDYPDLFEDIRHRVAEGRWEPLGGMWVEADCNLSGPESLARQFLLGRSFFHKHFGKVDSPVLWLPDVFGYSWALPQLIKEAGLKYFFTIKIGWSQYNRLPYDTFWWQGIDGSRVLTHFSTTPDPGGQWASTYNAEATPAQAIGTWTNFQQKEIQHNLLMAFGYGDGGGGPTREMLENIREMAAFPATPRMQQAHVGQFFQEVEAESGDRLPTWNGELYLELHRGTYTTQSRNKRANRKSEFILHDAEFLATYASLVDSNYQYPADKLHKAWELVCLNQFHDIIPGSSINPVYVESQQQYAEIHAAADEVRQAALSIIANKQAALANSDSDPVITIANTTGFKRDDLAFLPSRLPSNKKLALPDGTPALFQDTPDGTWIAANELPPFSITPLMISEGSTSSPGAGLSVSPTLLENQYLRVEFNPTGDIVRIFDKTNLREVLPPGAIANQFQAFEDRPVQWDAWDIDIFFDDKMWVSDPAASVKVVEAGPLRATLEIKRRILHSDYVQRISLVYNQPRLDFDTTIEWNERHILLKAAFPVDVLAPQATYEIQWGNVQRPTHRNTSWDWARFETCAQKWVDLSEGGYGVSLLNDCKYGHDVKGNVLRISLLRGTTSPDPLADLGEHRFAYSLFPHSGSVGTATVAAAYSLNDPLIARISEKKNPPSAQPSELLNKSFLSFMQPNVVVETIKGAEDSNGIIVRFYECQRQRGKVNLVTGFDIAAAWRTNLLEENQASLTPEGNQLELYVKPFEIITLRLVPKMP